MVDETENLNAPRPEASEYFVVEMVPGRYAICQRTMVLTFETDDPARLGFESSLNRNPLRAAIHPGASSGGDPKGPPSVRDLYKGETGRNAIVITINNSGCNPPQD